LEAALKKLSLTVSSFKNIILGIGPGSFTGLRIGATVAKALSFAKNIPIIGVSSLKAFDPSVNGPFGTLLDAKLHGVYLQKGLKEGGKIYYEEEAHIYSLDTIKKASETLPLLITSQRAPLITKLKGLVEEGKLKEYPPHPLQMLNLALKQPLKNHRQAHDPLDLKYFDVKG